MRDTTLTKRANRLRLDLELASDTLWRRLTADGQKQSVPYRELRKLQYVLTQHLGALPEVIPPRG